MKVVLIDVGTNAVRYLLARKEKEQWTDEETGGFITGLGSQRDPDGNLSKRAMVATQQAVSYLLQQLRKKEPSRIMVMATEAVRSAKNGAEFVEMLTKAVGLPIRVLSGEEEAYLSFLGATSGLRMGFRGDSLFAVADVGGGSTEISFGRQGAPSQFLTFPVGSRVLTEKFLLSDPPEVVEKEKAIAYAQETLQAASPDLHRSEILVLAGGTACNLATLRLNLTRFEPQRIHGLPVRRETVDYWLNLLSSVPAEERKQVKGLEVGREKVILGGLILLKVVMDLAGKETALISARSVLHGALLSFF
ncbi:MAG: hypothetical protein NZ959_10605 [Armatimonadetes bacterium]|nr:hypothetical protein [Armatimonadota bacterium]MDW8121120.1 hypothetical protein [Armatimonadota bacterium]